MSAAIIFPKLQPLSGDMNPAHIRGNVAASTELGLEEVLTDETVRLNPDRDATICIVNPGPSARTQEVMDYLNGAVAKDGGRMIRVLASAGYGMLSRGLATAEYCVVHHPGNIYLEKDATGQMVERIPGFGDRALQYLVASMATAGADPNNPSVFDLLMSKGHKPKIFHAHVEGVTSFPEDKIGVGTGSGAPVAALVLFAALGHRKFEVFGMDGSSAYAIDLSDTAAMQAYLQGLKDNEMAVNVGGRVFTITKDFWAQTQELMGFLRDYPEAVQSIRFSGDTANAAIFNSWDGRRFNCGPIAVLQKPSAGQAAPEAPKNPAL